MSYQVFLSGSQPVRMLFAPELIQQAKDFGWDTSEWEKKANKIVCRAGMEPSDAWILLPREALNNLTLLDEHTLSLPTATVGQFINMPGWVFQSAHSIDPSMDLTPGVGGGIESYSASPLPSFTPHIQQTVLVHFQDLRSRFIDSSTELDYNIIKSVQVDVEEVDTTPGDNESYETVTYYENTLNGASPWTWTEVLDDLKNNYIPGGSSINTAGFSIPDVTEPAADRIQSPTNLRSNGRTAWELFCDLLSATGHTLSHDTTTGDFLVKPINDSTSTTKTLMEAAVALVTTPVTPILEYRQETNTHTCLPEKTRLTFPSRRFNTSEPTTPEEIIPQDLLHHLSNYTKDISNTSVATGTPTFIPGSTYNINAEGYLYWTTTRHEEASPSPALRRPEQLDVLASHLAARYVAALETPGTEFLLHGCLDVDADQLYPWIEYDFSQTTDHAVTTRVRSGPCVPPNSSHSSQKSSAALPPELPLTKWAYVQLTENIDADKSGTAYFLWPTSTWDDPDVVLDFTDTTISGTVWNGTVETLNQDVRYLALYDYRIDRWIVPTSGSASLPDELRGTVNSFIAPGTASNTYGIVAIKSSPAPVPLPTGTPELTGTIYAADIHGIGGFAENDIVRAIKSVGIDSFNPGGGVVDVDWEILPVTTGTPIRAVSVDKLSVGQSGGDPVTSLTVDSTVTRYFSGTLSSTGDIWILANLHYDDLDPDGEEYPWLPALATFNGLESGSYDPNAVDDTNYPDPDERPVYRIDPIPHGDIPGYTTTTFAAAEDQGGASPVFKTGSFQTYVEDETGSWGHGPLITGVMYNLEEEAAAGTVGFISRGRGKFWLKPSCSVGSDYSA